MGARRPFLLKGAVPIDIHTRERSLEREIAPAIETAAAGISPSTRYGIGEAWSIPRESTSV